MPNGEALTGCSDIDRDVLDRSWGIRQSPESSSVDFGYTCNIGFVHVLSEQCQLAEDLPNCASLLLANHRIVCLAYVSVCGLRQYLMLLTVDHSHILVLFCWHIQQNATY